MSLVVVACAWRAKYRVQADVNNGNKVVSKKVPIDSLGVHPQNRGGVYPSGVRCVNLASKVLNLGVSKEEMNHVVVAVQECPHREIVNRGADYVTASDYNRRQSRKGPLLSSCFQSPYGDVQHKLLSHNHIMLVMRAFATQAKWQLDVTVQGLIYCDGNGSLSTTAVAAHPNGAELQEAWLQGLDCELLSWKMDV